MDAEQSIVEVADKLDAWWDRFSAMLDSDDRIAQGKALLQGFEIVKEFDRIKTDGLAAVTALTVSQNSMTAHNRTALLVRAFSFAAKLKSTLHDKMRDIDGETKIVRQMAIMADELRTLGDQSAFAVLLEDEDPRVRASIGAYLLVKNLMPDRVVPILREIEEQKNADNAHFVASWALFRWEHEGKHAKSSEGI
jgi:hypothetical protein